MTFGKEEVCAYLDSRGVVYDRVDHEAVFTMEAMDALSLPFANVVVKKRPVPMEMVGIQNRFGQVGSRDFLMKEYHLLSEDIVAAAEKAIARKAGKS